MSETHLVKTILHYLQLHRIFAYRNNTGAVQASYKGRTRYFHFGFPGSPDIVAVKDGQFIGIEAKLSGNKQSDLQKEFQRQLEAAGGMYILAYSLEDVISALG